MAMVVDLPAPLGPRQPQNVAGRHFERDVDHLGTYAVCLLQAIGP
jgi:hypothetical protein